jgi:hypothetical protein
MPRTPKNEPVFVGPPVSQNWMKEALHQHLKILERQWFPVELFLEIYPLIHISGSFPWCAPFYPALMNGSFYPHIIVYIEEWNPTPRSPPGPYHALAGRECAWDIHGWGGCDETWRVRKLWGSATIREYHGKVRMMNMCICIYIYMGKFWRPHTDLTGIMVSRGNYVTIPK